MVNKSNILLIMSGGVGKRFGADVPKQYCYMNGKPIIEYAIDVGRYAESVDEVVIVATEAYKDILFEKYGFPTTLGGSNRCESLANGLKYIHEHYECNKVIVANAVCPLMTEEQINKYFIFLDDYDYVLTCWKVVSTLHRYDNEFVDRDEFFNCMEPEAYRFDLLYDNYKSDFNVPYIFHQLPKTARGFYCFDYPYTMKITYSTDVKIAELLYKDLIWKPEEERIRKRANGWIASFENEGVTEWMLRVPEYMTELANRWDLIQYKMNPQAFSTCVYECTSRKYGDVIVKLHAPEGRFELELYYYQNNNLSCFPELFDYDRDYRALLIQKVVPGKQVGFDTSSLEQKSLFLEVSRNYISIDRSQKRDEFPDIMSNYFLNYRLARKYSFEMDFRECMNKKVLEIWDEYFKESKVYFLHRDLHARNILRGKDKLYVIDPLGIIGPKEYEYTISFIIECRKTQNVKNKYFEMLDYFSEYCERQRLYAATFIIFVHKMFEYVFTKQDNFKLANWTCNAIKEIFYDADEWKKDGKEGYPILLR